MVDSCRARCNESRACSWRPPMSPERSSLELQLTAALKALHEERLEHITERDESHAIIESLEKENHLLQQQTTAAKALAARLAKTAQSVVSPVYTPKPSRQNSARWPSSLREPSGNGRADGWRPRWPSGRIISREPSGNFGPDDGWRAGASASAAVLNTRHARKPKESSICSVM